MFCMSGDYVVWSVLSLIFLSLSYIVELPIIVCHNLAAVGR